MHSSARILIVDDDEDDFIITSDYIRSIPGSRFTLDWCKNYNEGLQHLRANKHDIYFVDYRLGAKSGVDFLREALSFGCDSPIVLLTGKGNYDVDIQAMQYGAVDYLVKTELTVEKMERCIRYALDRATTLIALKSNERKYRSIFEKSKDVVFVADSNLNFTDINEAITNLLGYDRQEALTSNLFDFIVQETQRKALQKCLERMADLNDYEITLVTRFGENKNCILSLTLEKNKEETNYVQGIIHDITNLKKIEKATLQAEKLAAAGRLVRTLAHEVRNPLNNILLSVEQMLQVPFDDDNSLYLSIIQRNSKRINDLISELLNTSRPSENTLTPVILQDVMNDVIATANDRLTLKKISLNLIYPDTPVEIFADNINIKLALQNIVINAIEAMNETNGELSISMADIHGYCALTITDNGCGISEENISRLFEPYFTQKRNGIGLGLTFTLNILQAHRAKIDVISKPGYGTTFTILFPIDDR